METKVVNLRHEPYTLYIGRGAGGVVPSRPGTRGWLGNPVAIGKQCQECGRHHRDAGSTLPCYKRYLHRKLQDHEWRAAFLESCGHTLGCFCKPGPCHGDVIISVLESIGAETVLVNS